jgi:hypothetical protein
MEWLSFAGGRHSRVTGPGTHLLKLITEFISGLAMQDQTGGDSRNNKRWLILPSNNACFVFGLSQQQVRDLAADHCTVVPQLVVHLPYWTRQSSRFQGGALSLFIAPEGSHSFISFLASIDLGGLSINWLPTMVTGPYVWTDVGLFKFPVVYQL